MARQDNKGRKLKEGESYRSDGRYDYRYTDEKTGKRKHVYAKSLPELREKEKQLQKDLDEEIVTDASAKKMTVNELFARYMESKELKDGTRKNYVSTWNNRVRDDLGLMKVVQVKPSHVKIFYAKLSKEGYSHSMIKLIHNLIYPSFEMAVDDNIIRKNPAKGGIGDYGKAAKEKKALTPAQQEKLLAFVKDSNVYNVYYPMLVIMIGTGLRAGELIGLTWSDVDMEKREIHIAEQLVYKNYGDGCKFHESTPKTDAGVRVIPMSDDVRKAFAEQRKLNFMRGIRADIEVGGKCGFIFTSKSGRPLMPNGLNNALKNIVAAYNKKEDAQAVKEKRKAELMPHISAHSLRHTGCTRMAENGLDMKVVQYVMGHANVGVTMEVYNHITEQARIEKEIAKMNTVKIG
ncbi:hypothetical protein P261_02294 [Lachnospiraceae bacterium TWA4]|nr:hypothetical protein P261_02294 [Lachnospiraceae bacterium TWA4]